MPYHTNREVTILNLKNRLTVIPEEIIANIELIDSYERVNRDLEDEERQAELEIERLQALQDAPDELS